MSKLGGKLIFLAAEHITAILRRGKRGPIIVGAVVGALAGASVGFWLVVIAPATALLAALAGATLAAALFTAPLPVLGVRAGEIEPFRLGAVVNSWTFASGEFRSIVVLLEHALYIARDDRAPWEAVLQSLSQGENPGLPGFTIIRVRELERIERRCADATVLQFVYCIDKCTLRRGADFATTADRDDFVSALEARCGRTFEGGERRVDLWDAVWPPLLVLTILVVLFGGVALLANHWTAHPPPPPPGKREQDDLVKLLRWAGAEGVLLAGAIASLPAVVWLAARVLYPPRLLVQWVKDR